MSIGQKPTWGLPFCGFPAEAESGLLHLRPSAGHEGSGTIAGNNACLIRPLHRNNNCLPTIEAAIRITDAEESFLFPPPPPPLFLISVQQWRLIFRSRCAFLLVNLSVQFQPNYRGGIEYVIFITIFFFFLSEERFSYPGILACL